MHRAHCIVISLVTGLLSKVAHILQMFLSRRYMHFHFVKSSFTPGLLLKVPKLMKRGSNDLSKKRSRGRKISPRAYDLWKQKNKRHAKPTLSPYKRKNIFALVAKNSFKQEVFFSYMQYVLNVCGHRWKMLFISTSMGFMHWIRFCCSVGNIKKVSANLVKSQRWCVKKANKSTILWQWRPSYYTKNMKCIIIQNILTSNLQQAVFHRNIFTK